MQQEHANAETSQARRNAQLPMFVRIAGAVLFLMGALLALASAGGALESVDLPLPAMWLAVILMAFGASDFVVARVLASHQNG